MSKYYKYYQETHDIDWFFQYHGRFFHVASNGGEIPDVVDKNNNRKIQHLVAMVDKVCKAKYTVEDPEGLDYSSFLEFAERGFISIDRKGDTFNSQNYFVIAKPQNDGVPSAGIAEIIPYLDIEENKLTIDGLSI